MYPNLYYAFKDIFGIELEFLKMFQSFGFFVAVSFLLAAYFFSRELKRKEVEGLLQSKPKKELKGEPVTWMELFTSGLVGFLVGYKLVFIAMNFSAFLDDTQGFLLSTEGSLFGGIICGFVFAVYKRQEKEKERLSEPKWVETQVHPYEHVGNMTLIAAVAGLLGAKVFHNLENWDLFIKDPVEQLLSFSGLTMYGGLICGSLAVVLYARKHGMNILHVIDACAPGLMLAYGTGRIGCQVSGDGDWGIDNLSSKPGWLNWLPDWAWAYNYPHNVNEMGIPIEGCEGKYCTMLENPVYPTPLYESVLCIGMFFVLWSLRKRIVAPGVLFSLYLLLNGIERFFIEKIRVNETYKIFGGEITQAEIISTVLIVLGIAGIWWFGKKHRNKPFTNGPAGDLS